MPTNATAVRPWPESAKEFEKIALDAFKKRWELRDVHLYARNGQKQYGVDIVGEAPDGQVFAAQCKNTRTPDISNLRSDAEKARAFPGGISVLYFAISSDTDGRIQDEIRRWKTEEEWPFQMHVLFWTDVCDELAPYPHLCRKHWPADYLPTEASTDEEPDLSLDRRITKSAEVVMSVRPDSTDVDAYIAVTLKNNSADTIELDRKCIVNWTITDAEASQVLYKYDGIDETPYWDHGDRLPGQYWFYIDVRGSLEPRASRVVGFHVLWTGLIHHDRGRYVLNDPHHRSDDDFPIIQSLLLPKNAAISAQTASAVTPNSAKWIFNSFGRQTRIQASWEYRSEDDLCGVDHTLLNEIRAKLGLSG